MHRKAARKPTPILMASVKSSAIAAIGHDPSTKTLRVEFCSGHVYDYSDVSVEDHQALTSAESIGRHFLQHVRSREFTRHEPKAA